MIARPAPGAAPARASPSGGPTQALPAPPAGLHGPGGPALLFAFSLAAVGAGAGRALTTTYLPVLLERIEDAPSLIGAVMTVNAVTGFAVPIAVGIWSDRRGRRLPFIAGGAVLTAGGLVAVAARQRAARTSPSPWPPASPTPGSTR